jgi:hypothetical protein
MAYDQASYGQEATQLTKNILADGDYTTRKVTILSGQTIVAGDVLGKITASGKYIKSLSAAVDGSQTPDFIAATDVDASGGDKEAIVYETGTVVGSALTLGTAHTIASIREGLRAKGLKIDD